MEPKNAASGVRGCTARLDSPIEAECYLEVDLIGWQPKLWATPPQNRNQTENSAVPVEENCR
jgi:hypothetical protein